MTRLAISLLLAAALGACTSPAPSPRLASAVASPAGQSPQGAAPGQIELACDDPYPGHCLQDVAFAVGHLPAAHAPVESVAVSAMAHPCSGTAACTQEPHHGDEWVAFVMRDGQQFGMWIASQMGIRDVQSAGANLSPVASIDPMAISYSLMCGAISTEVCTGAAAGGVVDNATPATVRVMPGTTTPYHVTFTYADGSQASVDVVRDETWEVGWSPLMPGATPAP